MTIAKKTCKPSVESVTPEVLDTNPTLDQDGQSNSDLREVWTANGNAVMQELVNRFVGLLPPLVGLASGDKIQEVDKKSSELVDKFVELFEAGVEGDSCKELLEVIDGALSPDAAMHGYLQSIAMASIGQQPFPDPMQAFPPGPPMAQVPLPQVPLPPPPIVEWPDEDFEEGEMVAEFGEEDEEEEYEDA